MEFFDYCFKQIDEQALAEALERAAINGAISIIGDVYKPTGNMIISGEFTISEMIQVPGYFCIVRTTAPLTAEQLANFEQISPPDLYRAWA